MKGQVFLLTAGIIIALLVALKGFAVVQQISSEREILDIALEDLFFKNIETEVERIIGFLANTPNTISDNSIDFLNFTRTGSDGHSLDFRALFVGTLSNTTKQTMNITVFQFLRENTLNVTIRLDTIPVQTNSTFLDDGGIWINNFTFTPGQKYNLTVSLPDKNYEENITVETKSNKDTYTGFFDLKLISIRAEHRSKVQQTIKIS
ncbi:MAG: hypothetical protein QXD72_01745 [Candidatus Aenigmatarchaeota archaeon]